MRHLSLACLAFALSCSGPAPTVLVVSVETDLSIPAGLDQIVIEVSRDDGMIQRRELSLSSATDFPITLGVQHREGPLEPLTVVARGNLAGTEIVRATAITGFIDEQSLILRMFLSSACQGVSCNADQTCDEGTCTGAYIDPTLLPPFDGDAGPAVDAGDAGPDDPDGDVDDAGTPDAGPNLDDTDGDTLRDTVECADLSMPAACRDTDGDGTPDYQDPDDDGDGIPTEQEVADAAEFGDDVDEDGLPNWRDTDSDDDGLLDGEEGIADTDGDGVPEYLDPRACSTERCGNGTDDDCDGIIDEPSECDPDGLIDVRMDPSGFAWDPADVQVEVRTMAGAAGALECRSGKVQPTGTLIGDFDGCPPGVFSPALDVASFGDGAYRTQVRLRGASGVVSRALDLDYYLHGSLVGATDCSILDNIPADRFFRKAAERLPTTGSGGADLRFSTTADPSAPGFAALANPFIRINFTPRLNRSFGFQLRGSTASWVQTDGELNVLSLRRHFVMNEDESMVLMGRRYSSRRNIDSNATSRCGAVSIKTHVGGSPDNPVRCDAVVLNREGAGVCLVVAAGGSVEFGRRPSPTLFGMLASSLVPPDEALTNGVDNALWRKLARRYSPNTTSSSSRATCASVGTRCAEQGISPRWGWRQFSAKCFGDPNCVDTLRALYLVGDNTEGYAPLYLPDDELYRF